MTINALAVRPGHQGSAALITRPQPRPTEDELLVEPLLVGVCGTDREIASGGYGEPPPGHEHLVIGHEAVARVLTPTAGLAEGELIVPIVRRPDPVPCDNCAAGEWDMCRNGLYTEHGIKGLDGFAAEQVTVAADHVVPVPVALGERAVLVEPASIVAKAWEQIDRISGRASWRPRVALVTGAGPVGLLAALLARQRGLETHVLDVVTTGPKPRLVADLGAEYHTGRVAGTCPVPDVIVECTGVGSVVLDAIAHNSPTGIVCLAGLSTGRRTVDLDAAVLNRSIVLENDVVFGTVNANRRHYTAAVHALADADPEWLERLIARRVPLANWADALTATPSDVKVVIEVNA